ncbi:hypothetical protein FQA39_LY02651 [Lamprigera yunnana]|nr:hypothetical protein FQA39_LY02651 [Lamprigera yunnana]
MKHNASITFLVFVRFLSIRCDGNSSEENVWDVLVFSQRWPITACSQWLKENVNNSCALPEDDLIWTVHGIWPTKSGNHKGPSNCNESWHFDESSVLPIEPDLKQLWTNLENNTKPTSLWKHEWEKHGTCAVTLLQLNNELKYFTKGLDLIKSYNMKNILSQRSIIPSLDGCYTAESFSYAIKNVLNYNPIIQCVVDIDSKKSLISELHICFDKSFNLMDCDCVKGRFEAVKDGDVITDCSLKKLIYYPTEVLPSSEESLYQLSYFDSDEQSTFEDLLKTRNYWIGIYKTLKFLIWATI